MTSGRVCRAWPANHPGVLLPQREPASPTPTPRPSALTACAHLDGCHPAGSGRLPTSVALLARRATGSFSASVRKTPRPRRAPRPPTSVVCSKSSHCSLRGEAPMSRLPGPLTSATGRWRRTHRSESGGHAACTSAVPAGSPPRLCFQMPSDPPRAHTHGCRGERQDLHG